MDNRPLHPPSPPPSLSVVIPTMGRPILLKTLASLAATEGFGALEICVAGKIPDLEVAAGLRAFLAAHPNARHLDIRFDTGDSSRKKNAGAEATSGELVAFLDDDVEVAPDWPLRIREPFADPAVGLACGPSLIPDDLPDWARWAGLALASPAAGYIAERYRENRDAPYPIDWDRIIGCNAVYRRTAFEQMGGFPADFYPGEEMIAAYRTERLGWALRFLPAAKVWHYPRSSPARFWRQVWGYGATRIRLVRGGVSFHPAPLVPGLWIAATLLLAVASFFLPAARWLLLADLAAYFLADLAVAAWTVRRTRRARDWALLAMVPLMHTAYGLAEWAELFRPGRDFTEPPRPR